MRWIPALLALALTGCVTAADDDDVTEPPAPPAPCAQWSPAERTGEVEDVDLNEISGLVASRANPGVLWVHEDSGAGPVLTALSSSGATVATLTLPGASSADWEDLALGRCPGAAAPQDGGPWCLVVADIGDNAAARPFVTLLWVEEPTVDAQASEPVHLQDDAFPVRATYEDGPQDAEAIVLEPDGSPIVLSKRSDGTTHLHRMPTTLTDPPTAAARIGELPTGEGTGLIDALTAADLTADGRRLLLRTYVGAWLFDLGDLALEDAATVSPRALATASEPQGEAIAWSGNERDILHVSEAVGPALYTLRCRD